MSRDFKFTIPLDQEYVLRSVPTKNGGERPVMVLRGWASDASIDKLNGKMSEECIVGMVRCVNEGRPTPLFNNTRAAMAERPGPRHQEVGIDVDHSDHWTDQIGRAIKAEAVYDLPTDMVARGAVAPVMYVEFEVDLRKAHGQDLKVALDDGDQLGLSIFGRVKRGYKEVNRATGQTVEHFEEVDLKKIAITSRPVNNVTWVQEIRRSMPGDEMEVLETQEAAQSDGAAETTSTEEVVDSPASEGITAPELEPQAPSDAAAPAGETEETASDVADDAESEGTQEGEASGEGTAETPAPVEPVAPVVEGLAPDAIADLMSVGAISAEAPRAEQAAAPETASAETAQVQTTEPQAGEVTRAMLDEYVTDEVFRSFETEVRSIVGELPETLSRAMDDIKTLFDRLEEQSKQVEDLVRALSDATAGRKGAAIIRSFAQEEAAASAVPPLTHELDQEARDRVYKTLVENGQGHMALALMLGMVPNTKNAAKEDPLVPQTDS